MQNQTPIIIAVDGYSSSGKSTMARSLARRLGYRYIDSGAMYRAVTLAALRSGLIDKSSGEVDRQGLIAILPTIKIDFKVKPDGRQVTLLDNQEVEDLIRGLEVSNKVSEIAAIPEVRCALVSMQQSFGASRGIVMDGRDIGTTVFPDAELKIFVNAPAETRARRRFLELQEKGLEASFEEILTNIKSRDRLDETREESPLRRAVDAIDIDNSEMTIAQQDALLDKIVAERLSTIHSKENQK